MAKARKVPKKTPEKLPTQKEIAAGAIQREKERVAKLTQEKAARKKPKRVVTQTTPPNLSETWIGKRTYCKPLDLITNSFKKGVAPKNLKRLEGRLGAKVGSPRFKVLLALLKCKTVGEARTKKLWTRAKAQFLHNAKMLKIISAETGKIVPLD